MKRSLLLTPTLGSLAILAASAWAQPATDSPPRSSDDSTVVLTPFTVTANQSGRYQSDESISGGRIRTNIMESASNIQVITSQLIEDTGALRILDAAKYASGVTESIVPNGLDRITIRGFQTDGQTIDGYYTLGQANIDDAIIDRLEIVKGPNAILSPKGTPGGTINVVTKKPLFARAGSFSAQAGLFDANRATLDVTGPLDRWPLAYRVVAAHQDSDGWYDNTHTKQTTVAPSLAWKAGPKTLVTVAGLYLHSQSTTYVGLPLDPSVGTNDLARLWDGVDRRLGIIPEDQLRVENRKTLTFEAVSGIGDHLSVRLAGRTVEAYTGTGQLNLGLSAPGGSYDPYTGNYVSGVIYGSASPFAATPAPAPTRIVTLAGVYQRIPGIRYYDLQNDYVFDYTWHDVTSTTLGGVAWSYNTSHTLQQNVSGGTQNIDALTPMAPLTYGAVNVDQKPETRTLQYYVMEKLGFFRNRLILTGGLSPFRGSGHLEDRIAGTNLSSPKTVHVKNYGIVLRPVPNVSLFFGHSESAIPSLTTVNIAEGIQKEGGIRVQALDGKVTVSASYFDIIQTNQAVPNPANLAVPPPPVPLPALLLDRRARGWELNFEGALTKNLTLIGNATVNRNRDANGVPFRATADESAALFVRYAFTTGMWRGFAIGVGADYLGKRPGDAVSGYAAASTPTHVVPRQPSFYLPGRTLFNLNLSYVRQHLIYRLAVENLFDRDYLAAAGSRTSVWPGTPINFKASLTYKL